jgi:hypothetical protein
MNTDKSSTHPTPRVRARRGGTGDQGLSGSDESWRAKPFSEYDAEDWKAYNGWAARTLRTHADRDEAAGRIDSTIAQIWRATADEFAARS